MATVLISGATGRMGGTGRHLVDVLAKDGLALRAMVRQEDERSEALRARGVEVVMADFLDEDAVRRAMHGVDIAYFCAPVFDVLLHATTVFALCAKEASVKRVINVSQLGTKDPILSPATRLHRLSEMIFDWSGVPTSHLRATVFLEQLTRIFAPGVKARSALVAPLNNQKLAMIAGIDVARVAAGIVRNLNGHGPGPYHVTGAPNFTMQDVAETLSQEIGRPIAYVDVDPVAWKQSAIERGMSPHLASHLDKLYEKGRLGRLDHTPTDVVQRVGGAAPMDLRTFIKENRAAFA